MKKIFFILTFITFYFLIFNSCINISTQGVIDLTQYKNNKILYKFENDTICQKVEIIYLNVNKIQFFLNCINTRLNDSIRLEGIATLITNELGNLELGEDEDGFAYDVNKYQYKDEDCWVYLSIENSKKDKLTISESQECFTKRNKYAPFNSIGILRLVTTK